VSVIQGFGRFISSDTVEVVSVDGTSNESSNTRYKFKKAVICTGGRAVIPTNIPGLADAPYTTNENLFNLRKLPKHMVVLGSGVVALEMAQTFATFGSKVTVLVRSDRLFPRGDEDVSPVIRRALEDDGVSFLTEAKINEVVTLKEVCDEENLPLMKVSVLTGGKEVAIESDCLLVATGRTPNIENLNLEAAGVNYDSKKGILVDDNAMSVSNPNVYSVGDCTADVPRLTHMSGEMAKVAVQNSLFNGNWKLKSLVVPACMYTEPEYATIGIQNAPEDEVDTYMALLEHNDRAILDSDQSGFVKILCKKGGGSIVGCTIISSRAGELINEVSLAMKHGISLEGIGRNIHPYPTTGESIMACGLQLINSKWKTLD